MMFFFCWFCVYILLENVFLCCLYNPMCYELNVNKQTTFLNAFIISTNITYIISNW